MGLFQRRWQVVKCQYLPHNATYVDCSRKIFILLTNQVL